MKWMGISYEELMALPNDYYAVIIEMIKEEHERHEEMTENE